MAIFAYARVSTEEQTVENQRQEIERAGYVIDYWFADQGVSGKTMAASRPQFKALLGQIRDGETLVVSKLDRLGRDAHDISGTIRMLRSRQIKVIVLQLGQLDLTSSAGKLMLTMLAALAEMERDMLVERTKAGLKRAESQGKVFGRKPKTNEAQRAAIRGHHAQGMSISALSRLYKVSRASIGRIIKQ